MRGKTPLSQLKKLVKLWSEFKLDDEDVSMDKGDAGSRFVNINLPGILWYAEQLRRDNILCYKQILEADDEIMRLQAIVGKSPQTKDGVHVPHGETVYKDGKSWRVVSLQETMEDHTGTGSTVYVSREDFSHIKPYAAMMSTTRGSGKKKEDWLILSDVDTCYSSLEAERKFIHEELKHAQAAYQALS